MTLEDFLSEARNHDTAKQIKIRVEGSAQIFTQLHIHVIDSDVTTISMVVLR
jgi:hypothetical protein